MVDRGICEHLVNGIITLGYPDWQNHSTVYWFVGANTIKRNKTVSSDSDFESVTQIPKSALAASPIEKCFRWSNRKNNISCKNNFI